MFEVGPIAPSTTLSALLDQGLVRAPGVADALTARIAALAGHRALYVSGGAVARSLGFPDIGLVTAVEMAQRVSEIHSVTPLPLIVDADTGHGGPLAVARTVNLFERAGASALHIEDQADPKRCAEYGGVRLLPGGEMAAKVRAAAAARRSSDFLIAARTDALGVTGLSDAVERAASYLSAGADLVFVESVRGEDDIAAAAAACGPTLLVNAADLGRAGIAPARAAELGCRVVIYPSELQRAAIRAMRIVAEALLDARGLGPHRALLASDEEREGAVGRAAAEAFEAWAEGASPSAS